MLVEMARRPKMVSGSILIPHKSPKFNFTARVVSEIFNIENVVTLKLGQRSLKVVESGTIR